MYSLKLRPSFLLLTFCILVFTYISIVLVIDGWSSILIPKKHCHHDIALVYTIRFPWGEGGAVRSIFEINNFGRTLREINNLLQELFQINM